LEPNRLTGYVIGFDKPSRTVKRSEGSPQPPVTGAGPTLDTLQPRLIETFSLTVKS
jgi:hypothetical protein